MLETKLREIDSKLDEMGLQNFNALSEVFKNLQEVHNLIKDALGNDQAN
jgi:hypothetical protein